MKIDTDKPEDINNIGEEDHLLFDENIANEENQGNHFDAYQYENQQKIFGANQDDDEDDPNVVDDDKESIDNNIQKNQAVQDNNNFIPDDFIFFKNKLNNQDSNDSDSNHGSDSDYNDGSDNTLGDTSPEDDPRAQTQLPYILRNLGSKGSDKELNKSSWDDAYPRIAPTIITKDVGIRMIKQYFEI